MAFPYMQLRDGTRVMQGLLAWIMDCPQLPDLKAYYNGEQIPEENLAELKRFFLVEEDGTIHPKTASCIAHCIECGF